MNIFKDLASIRYGEALAYEHLLRRRQWDVEHHARHEVDPDWDCSESLNAFHQGLLDEIALNGHQNDSIANGAYRRVVKAAQDAGEIPSGPKIVVVPLDLEPFDGETPEHFQDRWNEALFRAASEHEAFEEITGNLDPFSKPSLTDRIRAFFNQKGL